MRAVRAPQNFKEIVFPPSRISTIDVCELGRKKHHVTGLMEVDVTDARGIFRKMKEQNGESLSFTAWVAHCIAAAVDENRHVAAFIKSRRSIVIYDDIDITVTVEKEIAGQKVPMPLVIRKCSEKSVAEIHNEIRLAQRETTHEDSVVLRDHFSKQGIHLFYHIPSFLRRFILKSYLMKPRTAMKTMGSVVVTSLGMIGSSDGWFIPIGIHPLCIAVGSVVKKPGVVDDKIVIREYLKLTALIDHDVTDGAPAARFMTRLDELMRSCYGL